MGRSRSRSGCSHIPPSVYCKGAGGKGHRKRGGRSKSRGRSRCGRSRSRGRHRGRSRRGRSRRGRSRRGHGRRGHGRRGHSRRGRSRRGRSKRGHRRGRSGKRGHSRRGRSRRGRKGHGRRGKHCRPGPKTKNPFLNYLRVFRKKHCGWPQCKIAIEGAKCWCKMNNQDRQKFYREACSMRGKKGKKGGGGRRRRGGRRHGRSRGKRKSHNNCL